MIKFPVQIHVYKRKDGSLQRIDSLLLPEPGKYAIGRLPDNEIQLDASQVSREHAYLAIGPDGLLVSDRGSTNGTYVGDAKVEEDEPWDGAKPIRIEPYELRLAREEPAPVRAPRAAPAQPAQPAQPFRREGAIEIDLKPVTQIRLNEERQRKAEEEMSFPRALFKSDMVSISAIRSSKYTVSECEYLTLGGGLGSFVWADHLRLYGVPASAIRALGDVTWKQDDPNDFPRPYENYKRLCINSQIPDHERLRSNSISTPDNIWGFPGYASRETWRELKRFRLGGLKYIFQVFGEPAVAETYTPRAGDVFRSVGREARRIGWRDMCIPARVLQMRKTDDGRYVVAFKVLEDYQRGKGRDQLMIARFVHVATGYPAYRTVDDIFKFNTSNPEEKRAFKAYDAHDIIYYSLEHQPRPATVVVRGRGIVASRILQRLYEARNRNNQIRILHQMRTPVELGNKYARARRAAYNHTEIQPFNWPKGCWGGELRRVIEVAAPEVRAAIYSKIGGTSTAHRADWLGIINQGTREGWYQVAIGKLDITGISGPKGDRKMVMHYDGPTPGIPRDILVDYVVDCVGLEGEVRNSAFLKDMVETYRVPLNRDTTKAKPVDQGIACTPDFEIPALANGRGHVYAAGQITRWGPQAAVDSFLGLQYCALRSVDHMGSLGAPGVSSFGPLKSFGQWIKWCLNTPPR